MYRHSKYYGVLITRNVYRTAINISKIAKSEKIEIFLICSKYIII